LLAQTEGLQLLKGKWAEVSHRRLEQILAVFDKVEKRGEISLSDAPRTQMDMNGATELADDDIEIGNSEWLQNVREQLLNPASVKGVRASKNFKAKLRPYQQHGLDWPDTIHARSYGALLADDMGLSKTIRWPIRSTSVSSAKATGPCSWCPRR
jgi:non-specific serine/threonine protein kinase